MSTLVFTIVPVFFIFFFLQNKHLNFIHRAGRVDVDIISYLFGIKLGKKQIINVTEVCVSADHDVSTTTYKTEIWSEKNKDWITISPFGHQDQAKENRLADACLACLNNPNNTKQTVSIPRRKLGTVLLVIWVLFVIGVVTGNINLDTWGGSHYLKNE